MLVDSGPPRIRRSSTAWGFFSGALLIISADAAHWFFTPHPGATSTRLALVAGQLVVGALGALWAWRRGRRLEGGGILAGREGRSS